MIIDRLFEVVDADVIAKDFFRAFFASDQWRPRKCDERRVRQRIAHVQGQLIVLAAMRFICDDNDVVALGNRRITPSFIRAEFLDQSKDIPMIFLEKLL